MQVESQLVELASGVDALYLSARAALNDDLLFRLAEARGLAEDASGAVPFTLGRVELLMEVGGFGRYLYRLRHPNGLVGLTPKLKIPAARFQPRAEFLHGVGPAAVVEWFRQLVEPEYGPVYISVSRVDLHADWQGWGVGADDRARFVCRAKDRVTYETSGQFTGFQFGDRRTKTVSARIYDKTIESAEAGTDYWPDIWGSQYVVGERVMRVEFEVNNQALREYRVSGAEEVLGAAGALWSDLTERWLSYRTATEDGTKSRWPVAAEWEQVRRARIAAGALGIERTYGRRREGELRKLAPGLVGYLSSFAALSGHGSWEATVESLGPFVHHYGLVTWRCFEDRVADKAEEYGLP